MNLLVKMKMICMEHSLYIMILVRKKLNILALQKLIILMVVLKSRYQIGDIV